MNVESKRSNCFLDLIVSAGSIALLCFLIGVTVHAAEQIKASPQASETKQPIPDSEIIPRAEQTVKSLQKIKSEVAADSALTSIQTDLAAVAETYDRRRESESEAKRKLLSVQQLNEILREWNLEQSQLEHWNQVLAKRSQFLAAREKNIDEITETWHATQSAVAKKFFFKAVLERRVEEVLREVQATRSVVQEQTAKLLKLQNQITDRLATLAEIRKEIDRAREEFSRTLLNRDSPPLWQALIYSEARDVIVAQAAESARRLHDDLNEFVQRYSDRLLWHAAFFLAMIVLLWVLRRGLTPGGVERIGDPSALVILDRLVATSLLLALIAVPLFYSGATATILRIAVVPSVIPIVRLLPKLLPKITSWLYMLVALYILDFLRYLLPADWLLTRVLLLMTSAGGCVVLGLFLVSRRAVGAVLGSRERLVLLGARLGLVLFIVSVVSNLVGNVSLAEILISTPVRVTYVAALIFTAAQLLMTLTLVGLESRPAHWLRSVRDHRELIVLRCRALIRLAAFLFWATLSLFVVGILGDFLAAATARHSYKSTGSWERQRFPSKTSPFSLRCCSERLSFHECSALY